MENNKDQFIILKNDSNIEKDKEAESEFEIFGIINYGIIIKDWHQGKRSFVALETGEDTLLWFYVLMNEYLDENRDDEFDLRSYVRADTSYNEF